MNLERSFLIGFLGNYLINTVVVAVVALFQTVLGSGGTGLFTTQYVAFVVLAVVVVAVLSMWYMKDAPRNMKSGLIFGIVGFLVAIVTAFVTGIAGVLAQTGSLSSVVEVLPNFGPFIANWSTLILLAYWVVPATLIGWYMQPKAMAMPQSM